MPRITLPDAESLDQHHPGLKVPGALVRLDRYTTAQRRADGVLAFTLTDPDGNRVTLHRHGSTRWTVGVEMPNHAAGLPVTIPDVLVTRTNRLLSGTGMTLHRDWRTKTHTLKTAPRRVVPILDGVGLTADLYPSGWAAVPSSTALTHPPTPSAAPQAPALAPVAPTASPEVAPAEQEAEQEAEPEVAPAEPSPEARAIQQALPAAYAGKIVLSRQVRAKWQAARAVHRNGFPIVVAVIGPSGAGKTHSVHALSAEEGMEVVKFDASGVVEPGDWFGTVVLDSNGTKFVPSDLLTALTTPGKRTLLLDEMNRSNGRALQAMLPVLDGSGSLTVPQTGQQVRVNPEVQIVVTANIGSAFIHAEPLDEAVRTRIGLWLEVGHLAPPQEAALLVDRVPGMTRQHAEALAGLGSLVRTSAEQGDHAPVSTRQLLAAARLMAEGGLDPALAVEGAITDGYPSEGGEQSERFRVSLHAGGVRWPQPEPAPSLPEVAPTKTGRRTVREQVAPADPQAGYVAGQQAAVYTNPEPHPDCQCGHPKTDHGFAADGSPTRVSGGTFCIQNDPCTTYDPAMVPA